MKVLVIGSGAREHAIVHSLIGDPGVTAVVCAPGNPGIAAEAQIADLDSLTDPAAVVAVAREVGPDLVVVGPEAPLVAGVADALRAAGFVVFGPSAQAAQLEGSKAFAKQIMAAADVPTARAYVCTTDDQLTEALEATGAPYVVKDDGLAAGKGVVVTDDLTEAATHGQACLAQGGTVVVEEYLDGPEVSLFCISDGTDVVPLVPAQDFKRIFDGDQGPNTGGMGAYSPLDWAPDGLVDDVMERVARPTIAEMNRRGTPFAGVLYIGLALTSRGPRVVEFNARFGDPETQVVLARLVTPLSQVLLASATGTLGEQPELVWSQGAAVTVVVAAANYPATPRSGDPLAVPASTENSYVLHAGTKTTADGLVSAGGRVLSVVGLGSDLNEARKAAYALVDQVGLPGSQHRTDIALRAEQGQVAVPDVIS
ncbi:phosphoribosylamine--glycine ligase [Branchiibius hedensis]|uniref:Phosphoribosylamine--glycine ligase n=1 Tax=Branchiibius hedensis TaxID=672460 RepID=A0A2Y8ZSY7_9MICO|nr:phosphoribosylamine--glycine ligase [Branchiibius hedensis]PWJ26669.1 phosphoribosylamine--glycine ligase [Branchiibius hedensis]SSA35480.1 phosphoribosylamine--glycine ligase [Branchiibius hedensis]